MRKVYAALALAAAITAGAAGGYALHTHTPGPRPCSSPRLPSGDAMRAGNGTEYVCSDGTYVHVSHYGN